MPELDRRQLRMFPLADRHHKLDIGKIAVSPDAMAPELPENIQAQVTRLAARIVAARAAGKPVMLTYGAHLIKNGLGPVVARLLEEGWITHVATNGAGSIHDWEFAYLGVSTEDVRANTARGQFGTWEETGRAINLAVALGGVAGLGYGASVGKVIGEDGYHLPSRAELHDRLVTAAATPDDRLGAWADLLTLSSTFDLPTGWQALPHARKDVSVQYAAYRLGIPFTVHPGIGYDIIYTHPLNNGGAIGRGAVRDFLTYADSVSRMDDGGVHLTIGSAIMAPMIFEKSLSMANNQALAHGAPALAGYHLAVNDIADGGGWDWSQGEPPMENPAYYLRFCKTFYRMGGTLDYIGLDNRAFLVGLYRAVKTAATITKWGSTHCVSACAD